MQGFTRSTKRFALSCAFASLAAQAALAPSAVAKPADYAAIVADPGRSDAQKKLDDLRQPAIVLDFAGVKKGQVVADLYAGGGYFTMLLSPVVGPKGKVIAVNPTSFHKQESWDKVKARFANIDTFVAPADALHLPAASVNTIFTHLVWHDLYWVDEKFQHPKLDVDAELASWYKALKKGGTVIVVDHVGPKGDPREVVDRLHRIDPEQVKADMKKAGFKLVAESQALRNPQDDHQLNVFDKAIRGRTDRFMLKFRKP
ncbi:MAG: class I SAM-dependent methyltransferase [Novosphingobium sp.]